MEMAHGSNSWQKGQNNICTAFSVPCCQGLTQHAP